MTHRFSITLAQLTYFVECAKTLNMTAASQQMHVAQSAVSTAISHLERALDTTLFIRQHSKGIILTSAGESLLRDTQHLFALLEDTIDSLQADRAEIRGSITVSCFNTLAPFLLPQLIARLRVKHPDLTLEVIEGDYEEGLAALRGGRAEIAIGYNLTQAEDIERQIVGRARPYVLLPTDHPLAQRPEIALAELADEPFVMLDLPDSRDYFADILARAGITPPIGYRASNYETVRSMVAAGLGFSLLNQRPRIDGTYTGGHLATVEIADEVPSLEISVSSLAQVALSGRALAVAETVREVIADQRRG
ncbi:MAG: LysR family transcriptional regulator [Leucobacter sp.]